MELCNQFDICATEYHSIANVIIIEFPFNLINKTILAHVSTLLQNEEYFNDNRVSFTAHRIPMHGARIILRL